MIDQDAVANALRLMNIAHLAGRAYAQLSGGEQQAVLIARALAQGGRTLLLDEPASALDFGQQKRLWTRLRELAGTGYTILCTTHDRSGLAVFAVTGAEQPESLARRILDAEIIPRRGQLRITFPPFSEYSLRPVCAFHLVAQASPDEKYRRMVG